MSTGVPANDYRQRLINALAAIIARDGYHGAKVQDVAREAKVSLRTFYSEFPNKEECFLAFYDQVTTVINAAIVKPVDPALTWRENMAKSFEAYFEMLTVSPRLTHACMIELLTLSPHARARRHLAIGELESQIIAGVNEARAAYPEIPSRPLSPRMTRAVIGGLTELIIDKVERDEAGQLPELVDVATDLLWSVVTNVPAPADTPGSSAAFAPKSGVKTLEASSGADVRR